MALEDELRCSMFTKPEARPARDEQQKPSRHYDHDVVDLRKRKGHPVKHEFSEECRVL